MKDIEKELTSILPTSRIKCRLIDLVAYASDAGFYHLIPKAVVQPNSTDEIKSLFDFCNRKNIPLTFRTGGTSLSGQSITDGILVDLSQYWRKLEIQNNGDSILFQPGVIGSVANAHLKKYKRKIGPDPSSIASAMMGGILSNNSSGMCCGVTMNAYHTLQFIEFVLPNSKSYNTSIIADYQRFESENNDLFYGIIELKNKIESNELLLSKIRNKYLTKNTVGYALNAFIDYKHPLDIFAHLLIGAEGTLAFIAEASLHTVPDYPFKSTAFLYFPDIFSACDAIIPLKESGVNALELMDYASLKSIENIKGVPEIIKSLPVGSAALLIEYQEETSHKVALKVHEFEAITTQLKLLERPELTTDPYKQAFYWKLRKGMFPSVGAVRKQGTTVILEDIAFPVNVLGKAIYDLQKLFVQFEYNNAIIFGHAKDGNIHFVVTQAFDSESEIKRYSDFLNEVVHLVVNNYNGTLKAEHGTGRNMAPFVETEWGKEAYEIMVQLKKMVDPGNILNPNVIISEDEKIHLKNLKHLPVVESEVDKCIECGYCEQKCPSRDLTLTPRRRIVVRRALADLKATNKNDDYKVLLDQYQYDGLDTCAVDGMCATDCPVDINTGDLVKRLRSENHSNSANWIALVLSKNFLIVEKIVQFAVGFGYILNQILGKNFMIILTKSIKNLIPTFPLWSNQIIPTKKIQSHTNNSQNQKIIYFPTCINRVMGGSENGKKNIIETLISVSAKAKVDLFIPKNISGNCCGQPFSSKGFKTAYIQSANEFVAQAWKWSQEGSFPVMVDISSCTHTIKHSYSVLSDENKMKFNKLKIMDSVDYLHEYIIPNIQIKSKKENIALHPVCSLHKLGNYNQFVTIANNLAKEVTIPINGGCCGMAGDRGFLFPELTHSAIKMEANDLQNTPYEGYYSSSKTCEMSLSDIVGKNYESIAYLIDELT
ncbi:MAG: FAD-binding and (Fe-S)-binding domain-containing protein [Bacteroidota bacterium]|nr:FAD-binding and (Fe-S)-binding domain-containing protein [Bacteroidota bacterium]